MIFFKAWGQKTKKQTKHVQTKHVRIKQKDINYKNKPTSTKTNKQK